MVCMRFTNLLLGLLLSLVALRGSFAITHQASEALISTANHGDAIEDKKVLQVGQLGTMSSGRRSQQRLRGRKLGVEDHEVKKEVEGRRILNTGKAVKTSKKPFGSSKMDDEKTQKGVTAKLEPIRPSSHGSDDHEKTETQKLLEATDELNNMMSKDYQTRARKRPPINNHLPIEP